MAIVAMILEPSPWAQGYRAQQGRLGAGANVTMNTMLVP
jgi:hypothetical protein